MRCFLFSPPFHTHTDPFDQVSQWVMSYLSIIILIPWISMEQQFLDTLQTWFALGTQNLSDRPHVMMLKIFTMMCSSAKVSGWSSKYMCTDQLCYIYKNHFKVFYITNVQFSHWKSRKPSRRPSYPQIGSLMTLRVWYLPKDEFRRHVFGGWVNSVAHLLEKKNTIHLTCPQTACVLIQEVRIMNFQE